MGIKKNRMKAFLNFNIVQKLMLSLIVVAFASCAVKPSIPSGFPDEEEFSEIIADIHLSEAVLNQLRIRNRQIDRQSPAYYHDILKKHNLTEEQFDTIVSWYLSHPELYQEVYDMALSKLGREEAHWQRLDKDNKERQEQIKKEKERRNLWKTERKMTVLENDTIDRRVPFKFQVDTLVVSGYQLSAFYQFLKGSLVKNPQMELIAMYKDSTLDTVRYTLPTTYNSSKAEVNIGLENNDTIIELSGFLLNHDTLDVIKTRIKQIELEYIPFQDSLAIENEEDSSALLSSPR